MSLALASPSVNELRVPEGAPDGLRLMLLTELDEQHRAANAHTVMLELLSDEAAEVDTHAREATIRARSNALEAARELGLALARLDAGSYGRCEACGDPIGPARLEALPLTLHCIRCASRG